MPDPANLYRYPHPLNALINIYYLNNVADTVNVNTLNTYINEIHNNFKRYNTKLFDKLTLNIWNQYRSDIPRNKLDSAGNTIDYGIANYAGLTWGWDNRIDLNSTQTDTDAKLALVLSHEVGHLIDWKTEENRSDDIIMPEWRKIRGIPQQATIVEAELMAEDILYYDGCTGAKGIHRGAHGSAANVKGLRDMLLIWNPVFRFVKSIRSYNAKITNVSPQYSQADSGYFGIMFRAEYSATQQYNYYADRAGWQEFQPTTNTWKYILTF